MSAKAKLLPAKRVAGRRQDVWYVTDSTFSLYFQLLSPRAMAQRAAQGGQLTQLRPFALYRC